MAGEEYDFAFCCSAPDHSEPDAWALHNLDHLQRISHRGYGNPRRDPWSYGERTRAERISELDFAEQLAELD